MAMQRILIVKTTSMGDVIHALPVLSDIRHAFPDCQIDWMVESPFADLVNMNPHVHQCIPVALRTWRKSGPAEVWKQWKQLRDQLAATPYDCIIDLQGLIKSALLAKAADGPVYGPGFGYARETWACLVYARRGGWDPDAHAVERLRQLAAGLLGYSLQGPPSFDLKPVSQFSARNESTKTAWFLHATARAEKSWPIASWKELAHRLTHLGYEVALPWGTDLERKQAEDIALMIDGVTVLPKMNLGLLAEKMAQVDLVVGVDTGLTHLAAALHLPLVALYFATPQWRYAPRFNPNAISLGDLGRTPGVDEVFEACSRRMRLVKQG